MTGLDSRLRGLSNCSFHRTLRTFAARHQRLDPYWLTRNVRQPRPSANDQHSCHKVSRAFGQQGMYASAQGLGCMSLSAGYYHDSSTLGPEEDRIAVLHTALSNVFTLLSTADFYGPYDNHALIGKFLWRVCSCRVSRTRRRAY